jgi:hypothetical protein
MYIFYSVALFTLLSVLTYVAKPELIFCNHTSDDDASKQHVIYLAMIVLYAAISTFIFAFIELISN